MRNRIAWLIVGGALVCVLALVGTGLISAAVNGKFGTGSTTHAAAPQSKPVFGVIQVYMRNDTFIPAHIQVTLGTTVTWTNQDTVVHNVTLAQIDPSTFNNGESGPLYPGQSFSYTFTSRGTFQYYCQEHPFEMAGTVIVT